MKSEDVNARIKEFSSIREDAGNDEAAILEVALFIEDVFGILLSEGEICEENLGTHHNLEKFVLEKLERGSHVRNLRNS